MYTIASAIANIESQLTLLLVLTSICWFFGFVQVIEALRLSVRDRMPGQPIAMAVFLLAHDATFFMRYDYWLHTVHYWYFTILWFGMGPSVLIELFLLRYVLKYARPQIAPKMSQGTFVALIVLFQISAFLLLWWIQSLLTDPLYLVSLMSTNIAVVMFNIPFLIRRGNVAGQSRIFGWSALLGPASMSFTPMVLQAPVFGTWYLLGVSLILVALSIVYLVLLERYRRHPTPPI